MKSYFLLLFAESHIALFVIAPSLGLPVKRERERASLEHT
jgi:hypothetical protein